jgi:hypothetical protein
LKVYFIFIVVSFEYLSPKTQRITKSTNDLSLKSLFNLVKNRSKSLNFFVIISNIPKEPEINCKVILKVCLSRISQNLKVFTETLVR